MKYRIEWNNGNIEILPNVTSLKAGPYNLIITQVENERRSSLRRIWKRRNIVTRQTSWARVSEGIKSISTIE